MRGNGNQNTKSYINWVKNKGDIKDVHKKDQGLQISKAMVKCKAHKALYHNFIRNGQKQST